jgi:hypothetical protein
MDVQLRHLDRILLVSIDGLVIEADLAKLSGFLNTLASKLSVIVFDLHAAQVDPKAAATVFRLKKQYEKNRLRFLVVAPDIIGADSARMVDAISSIKSVESERIIELLAKESELVQVEKAITQARTALIGAMGLSQEGPEPVSDEDLSRSFRVLEDRNRQLMRLFKTLSSEITILQGEGVQDVPGQDNPAMAAIEEAKSRILDVLGSKGVVD